MDRPSPEAIAALLANADSSWRTLSGRLFTWDNEALLDMGRRRWHGRGATESTGSPQTHEVECIFYATADPWQLRLEIVRDTNSSSARYHTWAIHAQGWWATDGAVVVTNSNPEREASAYDLPALLRPSSLSSGLRILAAVRQEHRGRPGVRVQAEPKEELTWAAPELVVLGGNKHELIVDVELGIILKWEAHVDCQPARRDELLDLNVGASLDAGLFAPPAGLPLISPED